ncbi:p2 protein [Humulus japonicus latent virus]|uniref:RNA-directed RNA polymerase 2a n=1 Tax=Humulus japonicus latent virus TaxID=269213 RepID=Q6JE41_9BROM|nr:p2 protein [Humulus japonicus latent virus]AAS86439.1 p2 protein [Humulus japonicus latent virus]
MASFKDIVNALFASAQQKLGLSVPLLTGDKIIVNMPSNQKKKMELVAVPLLRENVRFSRETLVVFLRHPCLANMLNQWEFWAWEFNEELLPYGCSVTRVKDICVDGPYEDKSGYFHGSYTYAENSVYVDDYQVELCPLDDNMPPESVYEEGECSSKYQEVPPCEDVNLDGEEGENVGLLDMPEKDFQSLMHTRLQHLRDVGCSINLSGRGIPVIPIVAGGFSETTRLNPRHAESERVFKDRLEGPELKWAGPVFKDNLRAHSVDDMDVREWVAINRPIPKKKLPMKISGSIDAPLLNVREVSPVLNLVNNYIPKYQMLDWHALAKFINNYQAKEKPMDIKITSRGFANRHVFQQALDEILPHHHKFDDSFFQTMVECDDISIELSRCRLDLSVFNSWEKGSNKVKPMINSGVANRRFSTQREAMLAVQKRNMNVPNLAHCTDIPAVVAEVVDKFFKVIIDPDKLSQFPGFISEGELAYFEDYLRGKQPDPEMLKDPLCFQRLDKYRHMMKNNMKPVEDHSLNSERALMSTITYHEKGTIMSTSPIFLMAANRILMCLSDKVKIPTGKYHQLFSLDAHVLKHVKHWKEIDFSKFDKSQGELHHYLQREIFIRIGVPMNFIDAWVPQVTRSFISDPSNGLFFNVDFQRRTGDACTYLGNTLVTLCVLCHVYDLGDANVLSVVASGDDCLIGSYEKLDQSREYLCSTLFNFEAKFPYNQPFICSKFLIIAEMMDGREEVIAVPNPIKLLIKLGSKLNPEDFDEWFLAWRDHIHYFQNAHIVDQIVDLVEVRTGVRNTQCLRLALESFPHVFRSKKAVMREFFCMEEIESIERNRQIKAIKALNKKFKLPRSTTHVC